ncbi:hypothetical protein C8J55DRAFT_495278 [Lentinula edodes]|uniref:Uncharacterized protein n=1 Tax=Lentinula lateritia TaxID=40482 RepID=A0A9W9B1B5_9AGAR|nr:hypothetical protein C8J55DRAFT_495278 [Lentinula edodes]
MIQFRFKLFQALSFLFIAVAISHRLLAVVHASPIVNSTALHERGQTVKKIDSADMFLGYAYIPKSDSYAFIKEVGAQKVLKGKTLIMPSTKDRHIYDDPGKYYQIEIFVDPKVFNKLQPVYHQTRYAKSDSKSTVIVQKRHSLFGEPKSLDDLALWAKPNSYFTPDGTALTFNVEYVVPVDVPSTDEGWILHSDENADWHLWVNKIKDLPFTLDEH